MLRLEISTSSNFNHFQSIQPVSIFNCTIILSYSCSSGRLFTWTTVFIQVYKLQVTFKLLSDIHSFPLMMMSNMPPSTSCCQTFLWLTFHVKHQISSEVSNRCCYVAALYISNIFNVLIFVQMRCTSSTSTPGNIAVCSWNVLTQRDSASSDFWFKAHCWDCGAEPGQFGSD